MVDEKAMDTDAGAPAPVPAVDEVPQDWKLTVADKVCCCVVCAGRGGERGRTLSPRRCALVLFP
jgi:hypothetical protein